MSFIGGFLNVCAVLNKSDDVISMAELGIDTDVSEMVFTFQWKAHGYDAVRMTGG